MAPQEETNPGLVDLTTPDYAGKCGMCHPGGGPMEKDRNDNFLYEKSLSEIQADFDAGRIPGDYATWSSKDKKFVPFVWQIQVGDKTIDNTMAPACFYCHSAKALSSGVDTAAKGTLMFRMSLLGKLTGKHYFAAADALGGLLGTVNATTGEINYDPSLFDGNDMKGSNIVGKSSFSCGHCHGVFQFADFDNDGKVNGLDFVKAAKDPKFMHPDGMKEALVWQDNANMTDENGISKFVDVHRSHDVNCVDCHSSVKHDFIGEGYAPSGGYWFASHDFAKGNSGPAFGVMWNQMAGTLTCEKCHENAVDFHQAYFGPAAKTHLDKVACTTCHIGKKYFFRVKLIDWTLPMLVVTGNATSIKFAGLDKHGYLYGDPKNGKYEDIAWFPVRNANTGEVTWKIKPANAMGVLLFEDNSSGEFKPVFARYLAKVFKLNPDLPTKYLKVEIDPNTGKPKRVDGAIDPETGQPIKILNIKPGVGKISEDTDLASGNWTLWRATPNYIDVNLNGKYDEGVDVQITDDTGLNGAKDGDPELNTKEEVEAAINTLKKVISSATGKENVEVKLVATADAFGMSHNIRPAEEALTCADCHGGRSSELKGHLFTDKTPLYFPYEPEVENATYFDKKIDRAPTEEEFAEHIKEELISVGYPAGVVETSSGIKVEVKGKADVREKTPQEVASYFQLPADKIKAVVSVVPLGNEPITLEFQLPSSNDSYNVKVLNGTLEKVDKKDGKLIVTVVPKQSRAVTSDEIVVALVEGTSGTQASSGNAGGGGGGGCSITPTAGLGGAVSGILGLLPLGFLRRRRK